MFVYLGKELDHVDFAPSEMDNVPRHPTEPNFSNFANMSIANLRTYVVNLRFQQPDGANLTPFHLKVLEALDLQVLNRFTAQQANQLEQTARTELPNLLAAINPCDAVHQASLYSFSEMKQGIIEYCGYQHPVDPVGRILCENEQLVFWKSFEPVADSGVQGQLPAEVGALPDLQTWLFQMGQFCAGGVPKSLAMVQATQTTWDVGDVHSGGWVPVEVMNGIGVSFEHHQVQWSDGGWIPVADAPDVTRVKIAACVCSTNEIEDGRCNSVCPRTPALANTPVPEETVPGNNFPNQVWDPIGSDDAVLYPGFDPKWFARLGPHTLDEGRTYFKEKSIPENARGELFFTPTRFRDYDQALFATPPALPSSDDVYRRLPESWTGEFTARLSEQLPDVDGQEMAIRRVYSSPASIDEEAHAGTLSTGFIVDWNQSELRIIPGIVEDGVWRNPLSRWTVDDWVMLTDSAGATLMALGKNQVVRSITPLTNDPGVTGAAVLDTNAFKGFALAREASSGALTQLNLLDTRTATTVEAGGALAGLRDTTLLTLPGGLLVTGVRPGRGLQVYSVSRTGEVNLTLQWPLFTKVARVAGTHDRVLAKLGPLGAVIRLTAGGAQVDGLVFLPGKLHGASKLPGGYLFTSGGFVFGVDRDFSPGSLRIYPKTGLVSPNPADYQASSGARPTLIGQDKHVYTFDEVSRKWIPADLLRQVAP